MSNAEYGRFSADLLSNDTLRAEANKATVEASIAALAAFASSKGYSVTVEQLKAVASTAGTALSDAELDGVAGGIGGPTSGSYPPSYPRPSPTLLT
jgi:hypothetical protein